MSQSSLKTEHHLGTTPQPYGPTAPVVVPIFQNTTYAQRGPGEHGGFTYSRAHNPTVSALERALEHLEAPQAPAGSVHATAYSTGMAAITTLVLTLLENGDHAVCSEVIYGGTVRLFEEVLASVGIEATFVDTSEPAAVARALRPQTRLVLVESPGNPTLRLTDLSTVAGLCRAHGAFLAVDNTFLTPILQRPLEHGADGVVYSTTKFIEGHNCALGGALVLKDSDLHERVDRVRKTLGTIQTPFGAWLTLQGVKTLGVRMAAHSRSARNLARWLEDRPGVRRVLYPGLESFPQHALARRLGLTTDTTGGGLLAFEMEDAPTVLRALGRIRTAENLGAVETLATHPASMTHGDLSPERRRRLGIPDGLIRLSVGLEPVGQLKEDLERALVAGEVQP